MPQLESLSDKQSAADPIHSPDTPAASQGNETLDFPATLSGDENIQTGIFRPLRHRSQASRNKEDMG